MIKSLVTHFLSGSNRTFSLGARVRDKNLTCLASDKLRSINDCLKDVKEGRVAGNFLELGVALGGSAICIASDLKDDRRFIGFDVFGMIPPPSEQDGPIPKERYEKIKTGTSKGIGGEKYMATWTTFAMWLSGTSMTSALPSIGRKYDWFKVCSTNRSRTFRK